MTFVCVTTVFVATVATLKHKRVHLRPYGALPVDHIMSPLLDVVGTTSHNSAPYIWKIFPLCKNAQILRKFA